MSMLTVIQDFCARTNVPVPTTVAGTTDPQVRQIQSLLEEEGDDLAKRHPWESITFEASLTTVATESQGAISTIASNGFNYIKNETIWDRTDTLPVLGPLNASQWQAMKALASTGPRYRFRIRGGLLMVNPTPVAGHSWKFEYISKNWILAADGTTYKRRFTLDTDTLLVPEDLALMGLRWRWKKEKGFDYAEDLRTYESQFKDAAGREGGKPTLYMDNANWRGPKPGIFVPEGSWSL